MTGSINLTFKTNVNDIENKNEIFSFEKRTLICKFVRKMAVVLSRPQCVKIGIHASWTVCKRNVIRNDISITCCHIYNWWGYIKYDTTDLHECNKNDKNTHEHAVYKDVKHVMEETKEIFYSAMIIFGLCDWTLHHIHVWLRAYHLVKYADLNSSNL